VAASALALALTGLCCSGCSFSYQLGSLFGKEDDKPAVAEITQTISAKADKATVDGKFSEGDLIVASQVAAAVLARGEKDASAPWTNPATGARGMVTPIAQNYTQDGFTCRDFLASYVRETEESWLQGEACRVHHGKWVVRSLKPWKRA
jgi:surface antigen